MARNISPQMQSHLQQSMTTLSVMVKIVPQTESLLPPMHMTDHDLPLVYNGETYTPHDSFTISEIRTSVDFSSDNTQITLGGKDREWARKILNADVTIFMVNWNDLSMGQIDLYNGYVSQSSVNQDGDVELEISSKGKKLSQTFLPRYSRTCRATFGDEKCGLPVNVAYKRDVFMDQYPYAFKVRMHYVTGGVKVPWNPVPTLSTDYTVPNTAGIGNLIRFNFTKVASATNGMTILIEQKDSAGVVIQQLNLDKVEKNTSIFLLPTTATIKVSGTNIQSLDSVEEYTTFPTGREKLSRIGGGTARDQVPIANSDFYVNGTIAQTTAPDAITGWNVPNSVGHSITNAVVSSPNPGVTELEQVIVLPQLACILVTDNCYRMKLDIKGTNFTATAEFRDGSGAVVDTQTIPQTATDASVTFNPHPQAETVYLKISLTQGTLSSVKLYVWSLLETRGGEALEIVLNSAAEKGTHNDFWITMTDPINSETHVTAVAASPLDKIMFNILPHVALNNEQNIGLLFLTGANAGVKRDASVYDNTSGLISLVTELPYAPQVGDKVLANIGCDKYIETCADKRGNTISFRGEAFMPSVEKLNRISNL